MKKCPNKAIELFIQQIKIYENKIEIYLNYSITQQQNLEQSSTKVFTETQTTTRRFKGGTTKTFTKSYDVFIVI